MDTERASQLRPAQRKPGVRTLRAARRLRRPREFAQLIAAPATHSCTARGRWLAMKAAWRPLDPATATFPARLGLTVARRWVPRAVDRARLKRIVREEFRHAAEAIDAAAARAGVAVDLSIRMAAPWPTALSATEFKRALRVEAEQLLAPLPDRLLRLAVKGPTIPGSAANA